MCLRRTTAPPRRIDPRTQQNHRQDPRARRRKLRRISDGAGIAAAFPRAGRVLLVRTIQPASCSDARVCGRARNVSSAAARPPRVLQFADHHARGCLGARQQEQSPVDPFSHPSPQNVRSDRKYRSRRSWRSKGFESPIQKNKSDPAADQPPQGRFFDGRTEDASAANEDFRRGQCVPVGNIAESRVIRPRRRNTG